YLNQIDRTPYASGKVPANLTSLTLSLKLPTSTAGTVYVAVLGKNNMETSRTPVKYEAEPQTPMPDVSQLSLVNHKISAPDTITVSGLHKGDVIKVYDKNGKTLLGTFTATKDGTNTFSKSKLFGATASYVYISLTTTGMTESDLLQVNYSNEQ
ncbi:MAG: hypothetical protein ACXVP5_12115, partial [Tumebacillaceae bacterium]